MKTKGTLNLSVILLFLFLSLAHSWGSTFDVPPPADPSSDDDCTDFVCDLQSALDAAGNNSEEDTITIAAGTFTPPPGGFQYTPSGNNPINIIGSGAGSTIIDGGGANPLLRIDTTQGIGTDSNSHITIRGITFQNGTINGNDGGGLYVLTFDANILVEDCEFKNNKAITDNGGGFFARTNHNGTVTLLRNTFDTNAAGASGGGFYGFSVNGTVTLTENTFDTNASGSEGGGMYLQTQDGAITMTDNRGTTNAATTHGGALYATSFFSTVTLEGNSFDTNTSGGDGGGAYANATNGTVTLVNNTFSTNSAGSDGGGVWAESNSGTVTVTNNTVTDNSATSNGGGSYVYLWANGASADVYNNILWNNSGATGADMYIENDGDADLTASSANIFNNDFSDSAANRGGNLSQGSNINGDPLLTADFHLQSGSPCIDAGDQSAPSLPSIDFEGDARVSGSRPDIGADEFIQTGGVGSGGGCSIAQKSAATMPVVILLPIFFFIRKHIIGGSETK